MGTYLILLIIITINITDRRVIISQKYNPCKMYSLQS